MIKVLLDINVILDVLQKRKPHYEDAARLLTLCADAQIKGYVSDPSEAIERVTEFVSSG